MKNSLLRSLTLVMLSLFVVSCGRAPSNVLSGVKVETSTVENDIWMSFSADLNLGAMNFGSISVPVLHPQGQTPIGQLELVSGLGGVNQLKVQVNVSELSGVQATQAVLPNGNMIPLIANNQAIAINIGKGAQIYLILSQTVTAIGAAVPISAFDSIGSSLPGLNFFPVITTGNVIGTAGIFTGKNPGQSGIAVVADVSKVVNMNNLFPQAPLSRIAMEAQESQEVIKLSYKSQAGSSSQKSRLDSMLYQLNKRKTVLRMR